MEGGGKQQQQKIPNKVATKQDKKRVYRPRN